MAGPPIPERDEQGIDAYYAVIASWLDDSLSGRGDLAWWCERIREAEADPVLELGCGTARVTAAVAAKAGAGRRFIGLDRSAAMLARARSRLSNEAGVELVRGDLRRLPFRRASMRCAFAPADPFIHLAVDPDRQSAIEEAARVLAPRGRLLLEFLWWTPRERERARSAAGLERSRMVGDARGAAVRVDERWRESDGSCVRGTYRFRVGGRVAGEASFTGRRWMPAELGRRLREAGLEMVASWGDFDGRPFEPETARALLVEARRRPPAARRIG